MAKILSVIKRENGIRTIVQTEDGKGYCVDTARTWDHGPETMVFRYDIRAGQVKGWHDLYMRRYATMEEAYKGHDEVAEGLDTLLS